MCELLITWIHDPPNHDFRFIPLIQISLQLPASPSKKGVSLSRFFPNKSCKRTFCSDCVRTSDIKLDLEHANDGPCLVVSWSHSNSSQIIGYPIIILAINSLYSHIFVTHIQGSRSLKPMKCSSMWHSPHSASRKIKHAKCSSNTGPLLGGQYLYCWERFTWL